MPFGGGRAGWVLSVVNAPRWGWLLPSPPLQSARWVLWGRAARVVSCVWLVSPFCGGCAFRGVAGVII
uniref:Uncharacterized protein n=1 Tax=Phage sp. ctesc4 TaxID=2828008 RepID=A0A8S5TDD5_9VIRU|nr:MAG TPA: hypothetical protein [Phage sp. ctesc4]DAV25685.1 MAG TPA: hypothetical protein [Caudoviricetes sp.]